MKSLLITLMFIGISEISWAYETRVFIGLAYELDGNKLLYSEEHQIRYNGEKPISGDVYYRDANDNELGVKRSHYREPTRPAYEFDFTGLERETEKVDPIDSGVQVVSVRSGDLDWPGGHAVIDSGFHYFILEHFQHLLAENTLHFEFLAPTRVSWTSLVIEPISNSNDILVMQLKPRNRLIALFFDPIVLSYEVSSRRLLEYRGLTNVPKVGGGNFTARIEYQYNGDD